MAQSGSKLSLRGGGSRLGRLEWKGRLPSACISSTAYSSELLSSLPLPLPPSPPSPAKFRKSTGGARSPTIPCTNPKSLGDGHLEFSLLPTSPEWINHVWMNSKLAGCKATCYLTSIGSGQDHIWGRRSIRLHLSQWLFLPPHRFSPSFGALPLVLLPGEEH